MNIYYKRVQLLKTVPGEQFPSAFFTKRFSDDEGSRKECDRTDTFMQKKVGTKKITSVDCFPDSKYCPFFQLIKVLRNFKNEGKRSLIPRRIEKLTVRCLGALCNNTYLVLIDHDLPFRAIFFPLSIGSDARKHVSISEDDRSPVDNFICGITFQ